MIEQRSKDEIMRSEENKKRLLERFEIYKIDDIYSEIDDIYDKVSDKIS